MEQSVIRTEDDNTVNQPVLLLPEDRTLPPQLLHISSAII